MPDSAAKRKWKAENTRNIVITINKNTDKEIFDFLEQLDVPFGAVFKTAIKEYIANHKQKEQG